MGSDSDLPVIRKATDTLRALGIPFEAHVYSAHRTPDEAMTFARSAKENGFGVIIAAAGMAAHLAGAIAANTTLPVIGIPCKSNIPSRSHRKHSRRARPPPCPRRCAASRTCSARDGTPGTRDRPDIAGSCP